MGAFFLIFEMCVETQCLASQKGKLIMRRNALRLKKTIDEY